MAMADEHESLTNSFKSSKRKGYGAAIPSSNTSCQPKSVIVTHKVSKSDSLTSLAIQYNSTVADIKRVNKIWNNNGLTFSDTIEIPVFDSAGSSQTALRTTNPSDIRVTLTSSGATNGEELSHDDFFHEFDDHRLEVSVKAKTPSTHEHQSVVEKSPHELTSNGAAEDYKASNNDFFSKFDQSLSFLKKRVEDQAFSSTQYAEGDLSTHRSNIVPSNQKQDRPSQNGMSRDSSSLRSSRSSIRSAEDVGKTTPEPVIRAKVNKKMKKYEERQDELFTL